MAFRFRQFTVEDQQSTLRVGTDAMLLGSWANPEMAKKILDIGTGCGVLALMMAQKSTAKIDAIDIDEHSVAEARNNFLKSPWQARISAFHDSLQSFSNQSDAAYDFIITNPPYFSNSLKSPSARLSRARHDESLSLPELAHIAGCLLVAKGCFSVILPSEATQKFEVVCAGNGLYLSRKLIVYPRPGTPAKRTLLEFTKDKSGFPLTYELTILAGSGKFTPEYLALTGQFHNM
ncbi:MAG: methyltransferase [Bacteroidetes bacterium]|nr:methyltransferase [Bacteroidota bacterium]